MLCRNVCFTLLDKSGILFIVGGMFVFQTIKKVKQLSDGVANKPSNYDLTETIYFDDADVFMEDSGGCVSDNLLGLSSTLSGIVNLDGVSLGADEILSEHLSSLTSDILNGE